MNRRSFLKAGTGTLGAIALPTIIPGAVLGADGETPAGERIRLGFIGVRNRGMQNLEPMIKHAVALCDVDRDVLALAKARVDKANGGNCAAYSDYRELLAAKDIDGVVISTPDHWHALQMIDACEAGKDVYCEKPLSLTVEEGRRMVRAARKNNRVVQTGSQQRSDDKFRRACELIRNGTLGKLKLVEVGLPGPNFKGPAVPDQPPPPELDYDFWQGPAAVRPFNPLHVHYWFRFFWAYSGGQMTNFGAHHLDIAQWALGMDESGPVSIEGFASFEPHGWYETPEKFEVLYDYANGVRVRCATGLRGGVTFTGEKGTLYVTRGKIEADPKEILNEMLSPGDVRLYDSKDHYKNWLECIKSRKAPICDVAIGHRSATVCHLGNIAIRSGRKVKWDPARERILGDEEQAKMLHYGYRKPWKLAV